MSFNLTVTSWSFPQATLSEVIGISKALGVNAVDVGYFYASALDKDLVLKDPDKAAENLKAMDFDSPNLYHLFGEGHHDRNLADPESLKQNLADFEQATKFCKAANIPTIFILPGIVNPGQSRKTALAQSAIAMNEMQSIAKDANVIMGFEPHVHSFCESPSLTLELLEKAEGVKLTLDYAHFVCLGYTQEEIDILAPHACHVHLRQAHPGALQAKTDLGTINIPAQLATYKETNYEGYIALEYVHQDFMGTLYDDVLTETIKLRNIIYDWSK